MAKNSNRFSFDGGAATYVGTGVLAFLITVFTLGICYPFAVVLRQRWRAKHTYIDGRRLVFTGSAVGLFGNWIKWFLLMVVTFGLYSFWVMPRMVRWITVNTDFDPAFVPGAPVDTPAVAGQPDRPALPPAPAAIDTLGAPAADVVPPANQA